MKDPNYGLKNNDKGVLHELLVAKILHPDNELPGRPPIHEDYVPPKKKTKSKARAETSNDLYHVITALVSPEQLQDHQRIAEFAAEKILEGLRENGHISAENGNSRITNVYWTSKPDDIYKLTGVVDKANSSDIVMAKAPTRTMIETNGGPAQGGELIGISLKIHNEPKTSNLANPGRMSVDKILGVSTDQLEADELARAHVAAEKFGVRTRGIAKTCKGSGARTENAHDSTKNHRELRKVLNKSGLQTKTAITNTWREAMKSYDSREIANTLRTLVNIKPTKIPVYKSTTYGTKNLTHEFGNPVVEMEAILQTHKGYIHINPKEKGTTINIYGRKDDKGKPIPIGKLTSKYGSSTIFTGVVATVQGWTKTSKKSITFEAIEYAKQLHGYQ